MDALEAIRTRRSVRKFEDRPVDEEQMTELLRAAMSAPSAGDERPWHFIVITDRKLLDEIPSVHPYSGACKESPAAVAVCGDLTLEKHRGFWVQDCAAATENLLLAARALGLGTVWLGVYPDEDRVLGVRRLLNIPNTVIPFAIIPVGHPAEEKPSSDRYDESRVRRDLWVKF